MPQTSTDTTQAKSPATDLIADCLVMLGAVRLRVDGVLARWSDRDAVARLQDDKALAFLAELNACDHALNQLQALVHLQPGGSEQLELDMSDLHIILSRARHAL